MNDRQTPHVKTVADVAKPSGVHDVFLLEMTKTISLTVHAVTISQKAPEINNELNTATLSTTFCILARILY